MAQQHSQKVFIHATGNNVPESNQKTRRAWLPNVQNKRLYSAALDEQIPLKVTTAELRVIDKLGGLDEYVSGHEVLGKKGQQLKQLVLEARQKKQVNDSKQEAVAERIRSGASRLLGTLGSRPAVQAGKTAGKRVQAIP